MSAACSAFEWSWPRSIIFVLALLALTGSPGAGLVTAAVPSPLQTERDGLLAPRLRANHMNAALLFVVVAFAVHAPSLSNRVFNSDEAYLATQAQVLNRGGRLYVDTVDRKPPASSSAIDSSRSLT